MFLDEAIFQHEFFYNFQLQHCMVPEKKLKKNEMKAVSPLSTKWHYMPNSYANTDHQVHKGFMKHCTETVKSASSLMNAAKKL